MQCARFGRPCNNGMRALLGNNMELEQIKTRGRSVGLSGYVLESSTRILIQAIQKAEGGESCFMSENRFLCQKYDCEWRRDCQKLTAVWRR